MPDAAGSVPDTAVRVETMSTSELVRRLGSCAAVSVDHHAFREAADPVLREAIGYDVAAWVSIDPATLLFTSCDVFTPAGPGGNSQQREEALFASEFSGEDPLTIAQIVRSGRRVSRLRAEVSDLSSVVRYRNLMEPEGVIDEMRMVAADRWGVWGAIILYRSGQWAPFSEENQQVAEALASDLADLFRQAFLRAALDAHSLARPPGSLSLNSSGEVVASSAPAESWLDTLTGPQISGAFNALRHSVEREGLVRLMVMGAEGPVMFHGHRRKGADGLVDVIVEQPRAVELAEIIMAAHRLTPREAAVTRVVCQGGTNRQIASQLEISTYTVQDHIKSVFYKFGVSTRSELLHLLYSRYYQPHRTRDTPPGPYGYFLDA